MTVRLLCIVGFFGARCAKFAKELSRGISEIHLGSQRKNLSFFFLKFGVEGAAGAKKKSNIMVIKADSDRTSLRVLEIQDLGAAGSKKYGLLAVLKGI